MSRAKTIAVRTVKPLVGETVWNNLKRLDPGSRNAQKASQINSSPAEQLTPAQERRRMYRAMSLTELGEKFRTDKATAHHYTQHYDRHFAHLRDEKINVLEIGIGGYAREGKGGNSLRMWRAYFQRAQIIGLDIQDKSFVDGKRIKTYQGSQVDEQILTKIHESDGPFQIIIDDGSHRPEHIRETFRLLFPVLDENGIYAIEDTQTSYWPSWGGSFDLNARDTTMALVKDLLDGLNYEELAPESGHEPTYSDRNVVAVHAYHNLVIIEKGRNCEGSNRPPEKRR